VRPTIALNERNIEFEKSWAEQGIKDGAKLVVYGSLDYSQRKLS
jgi:hypothetical protein